MRTCETVDGLRGGIEHEHRELVAANPGHRISFSGHRSDRRGNRHDHRVARRVAEAIVDALEVVQVGRHDRERQTIRETRKRPLELAAVGQLGQRVGERLGLDKLVRRGVRQRQFRQAADQQDPLEDTRLDRVPASRHAQDSSELPVQLIGT